jgi:hypothetical protein
MVAATAVVAEAVRPAPGLVQVDRARADRGQVVPVQATVVPVTEAAVPAQATVVQVTEAAVPAQATVVQVTEAAVPAQVAAVPVQAAAAVTAAVPVTEGADRVTADLDPATVARAGLVDLADPADPVDRPGPQYGTTSSYLI